MALHPELGYFDEGADLTDPSLYEGARGEFGHASILNPVAFRSRIFAELEDEKIWTRLWCCIGSEQQIPAVGDLLPYTLGNHGVHVQRTETGYSGRFNFAQHGGCRAVPAQCQTGTKTRCSYTSCGYSRDRDVIRIADVDEDTPVLRHFVGDMPERMLPVSVDTWQGRVFVNIDQNAASLQEQLTGLDGAIGVDLAAFEDQAGFWQKHDGNWKVLLGALAQTLGDEFDDGRGDPMVQPAPTTMTDDIAPGFVVARETASAGADPRTLCWVFPNLILDISGPWFAMIIVQPTGLDESLVRVRIAGTAAVAGDASAIAAQKIRWQERLQRANDLAGWRQKEFSEWGTPHKPETSVDVLPTAEGGAAYLFQRYLIERLLAEHDYVWNAPLYTSARR
ncbi:MAG: Rieske (2Fe-2S) protein [Alphaproteobacteria bacterium]|nr:Rieske (2Fe-2S) protein [Alphaproteobacteria bacterium]